ncbi:Fructose-1,6-bisphosphatase class 1 [compost metagenome]
MAFIVEQAGGKASDGLNRILSIDPEALHQRSALFIGSPKMVEMAEALMAEHSPVASKAKADATVLNP